MSLRLIQTTHPSSWCGQLRELILENLAQTSSSRDWEHKSQTRHHCISLAALARRTTSLSRRKRSMALCSVLTAVNRRPHGQHLSKEDLSEAGSQWLGADLTHDQ